MYIASDGVDSRPQVRITLNTFSDVYSNMGGSMIYCEQSEVWISSITF